MTAARGVNEKMVLRIIDHNGKLLGLDQLGFFQDVLTLFEEIIKKPDGIILVTGPTGSGKSSTLYATLRRLSHYYGNKKNIVSMEDPVEHFVPGITQGQINVKAGFTFADGIRSVLRQDPDIIMVGEIRDRETCEMAIKAALTGHLVFSTLHTNDAPSSYTRLIDMGIEPFLITSTVIGILAQRLVRRICPRCKEPFEPTPELLQKFGLKPGFVMYRGTGCRTCNNTGYRGRIGIFEFLSPDSHVQNLVLKKASSDEIKKYCLEKNVFVTMRGDGLQKIAEGITTLEQVLGVTQNGETEAVTSSLRAVASR
jgi:type IV pilus assembly protein PilB